MTKLMRAINTNVLTFPELNPEPQVYTGGPDRIYLVDQTGHVAYKSKPGPFGFKADQLADALGKLPKS